MTVIETRRTSRRGKVVVTGATLLGAGLLGVVIMAVELVAFAVIAYVGLFGWLVCV